MQTGCPFGNYSKDLKFGLEISLYVFLESGLEKFAYSDLRSPPMSCSISDWAKSLIPDSRSCGLLFSSPDCAKRMIRRDRGTLRRLGSTRPATRRGSKKGWKLLACSGGSMQILAAKQKPRQIDGARNTSRSNLLRNYCRLGALFVISPRWEPISGCRLDLPSGDFSNTT